MVYWLCVGGRIRPGGFEKTNLIGLAYLGQPFLFAALLLYHSGYLSLVVEVLVNRKHMSIDNPCGSSHAAVI